MECALHVTCAPASFLFHFLVVLIAIARIKIIAAVGCAIWWVIVIVVLNPRRAPFTHRYTHILLEQST